MTLSCHESFRTLQTWSIIRKPGFPGTNYKFQMFKCWWWRGDCMSSIQIKGLYIFAGSRLSSIACRQSCNSHTVKKEMKCGGDSDKLHEIVHDMSRTSLCNYDFRNITNYFVISCSLSAFPLHFISFWIVQLLTVSLNLLACRYSWS